MDRAFEVGQRVYLRDYPWGKPLNIFGKIVGYINKDTYNVLLSNGINAGTIRPFREWSLTKEECPMTVQKQERVKDTTGEHPTLIATEC